MQGKHRLRVRVGKNPDGDADVNMGSFRLPRRLVRKLMGLTPRVTVLIPGDRVGKVEILDTPEQREARQGLRVVERTFEMEGAAS